jgi:hypothetical protein
MQFGFLRESVDIEFYFSNVLHFNWSINRNNKHKMKNKEIAHCPNIPKSNIKIIEEGQFDTP